MRSDGPLGRLLAHPSTRGLDLDSPETTAVRREILRGKPFLKAIYQEWYEMIISRIPDGDGDVLEIGAGGGFLDELIPSLITSDILPVPGVDRVVDAMDMDFNNGTLKAIVMTNVFHHIPDVSRFLSEAQRTLRPAGRIIMIEPWNTAWSRFVHRWLHHEPMIPESPKWEFPTTGPLSGANAALPWMVVERDREHLEREWPYLRVLEKEPFMPFRYLASGGISMRSLQPMWLFESWKRIEDTRLGRRMAVFALVSIERLERGQESGSAPDLDPTGR